MMAKKKDLNVAGMERLFSKDTLNTEDTKDTDSTKNTESFYRINLKLAGSLRQYLSDEAWQQRTSITQLVNDILLDYASNHPHK